MQAYPGTKKQTCIRGNSVFFKIWACASKGDSLFYVCQVPKNLGKATIDKHRVVNNDTNNDDEMSDMHSKSESAARALKRNVNISDDTNIIAVNNQQVDPVQALPKLSPGKQSG